MKKFFKYGGYETLVTEADYRAGFIVDETSRVGGGKAIASSYADSDAPPSIVLHTPEIVSKSRKGLMRWFGSKLRPYVYHLVVSMPGENGAHWKALNKWSKVRRKLEGKHNSASRQSALKSGFIAKIQRYPFGQPAGALRHPRNTVHTNHRRCIQIAFEGYAADAHNTPAQTYNMLIEVVAEAVLWIRLNWQADFELLPLRDVGIGGAAYGANGLGRISEEEWVGLVTKDGRRFNFLGHEALPGWVKNTKTGKMVKGNTHWDPGKLDYARIAEGAMGMVRLWEGRVQTEAAKENRSELVELQVLRDLRATHSKDIEALNIMLAELEQQVEQMREKLDEFKQAAKERSADVIRN